MTTGPYAGLGVSLGRVATAAAMSAPVVTPAAAASSFLAEHAGGAPDLGIVRLDQLFTIADGEQGWALATHKSAADLGWLLDPSDRFAPWRLPTEPAVV